MIPDEPPVKPKLKAISWKMKKIAIVITTNVCRRARRATRPNGTATIAPATAPSGISQNTDSPLRCQCWARMATVYAPVPKNTAWPSEM